MIVVDSNIIAARAPALLRFGSNLVRSRIKSGMTMSFWNFCPVLYALCDFIFQWEVKPWLRRK